MKIQRLSCADPLSLLRLPLQLSRISCGFVNPCDDHRDRQLDLNEHVIEHPAATYFARAQGDSMRGVGILDGDLLVVDRALSPQQGHAVIAFVEGEYTCKLLDLQRRQLRSANPAFPPLTLGEDTEAVIEGVVTHAIHDLRLPLHLDRCEHTEPVAARDRAK